MVIRLEGNIKTYFIYGVYIGPHRSIILIIFSGALVKSPIKTKLNNININLNLNLNLHLNLNLNLT